MPNDIQEYGAWDFINASDGETASSAFPIGQNYNDVSLDSFSFQEFPYGIEAALPPAENHETIPTIGGLFQPDEMPAMVSQFDESQVFSTAFPESASSFQNVGYSPIPSQLPDWSVIPDAPVPNLHANKMDTGCGIVTDQISSDILRNSSHNTDEYIADLSNFLLDVNDDDKLVYTRSDGNDHEMSDASSFDFRSFLLDTPVEDNRTDKGVSEISKAPDQQPMKSSPLAVDPALTEVQGGVINCTLNTEELEVPNNDDIFLPVKTLSTSFALMVHKENVKTHHERNFLKKREQNSHVPSHISSSMTGHQPIERNYSGMKYQLEKLKRTINRIKWAPDARTQIPIAVLHGRHSRHFIRKTQAIIKDGCSWSVPLAEHW
ncbi:hypothetical protein K7X08_001764 [Anisodus acutangulus]|uniref:Uncharacterized protein n=1 Tax=Anisodus acutangulus TaxID=402998 RepID=A0A9Q1R4U1_9SOLA|nr:hypothetical protein K7X08_001764 [Anisodus acutangulus]